MNQKSTNNFLQWLKKHKPIKVTSILDDRLFVVQLFLPLLIYTGIKPESENTGFFIFSFLLCLFLSINALKKAKPNQCS